MSDDYEGLPDTPMTSLDQNAASLHEMYMSYMDAGFSEERAFSLATTILLHYLDS
jgi:hypothetical protein